MLVMKAGEKAVSCGASKASEIEELSFVKVLHLRFLSFFFFFFFLIELNINYS
jgi:hypothetical protein